MIATFCDSCKKFAFFEKNRCYYQIYAKKLAVVSANKSFFRQTFYRNIFKIITSVPVLTARTVFDVVHSSCELQP
jgi:hypothetical protein